MIRREITYTNYNGQKVTKPFYFNMNKMELVETMVDENNQSFLDVVQSLADSGDFYSLIRVLKKIILAAYGEKSDDGERFVKSDEIRRGFEESPAFPELYISLLTDTKQMIDFVNGILPSDVQGTAEQIKAAIATAEKANEDYAAQRRSAFVEIDPDGNIVSVEEDPSQLKLIDEEIPSKE